VTIVTYNLTFFWKKDSMLYLSHLARKVLFLTIFLSFCAFGHKISPAQVPNSGELQLQVKDPSGAVLQASGTLTGPSTRKTYQTDAQGRFTFSGLTAGQYTLAVSQTGFASQTVGLDIETAPVTREITLAVGTVSTSVAVFSPTPIGNADVSLDQIPVPVQTLDAKQLEDSNALDLSDLMNKRLTSVYINGNQGNPYQPDINYRGYTASPLLGTPEGLSVFVDGVRQNQPFGDVVAWDLIPRVAIRDMALVPGSDPLYGLNALGGAVAVQTKSGLTAPGISLQITGGKFGRRAIEGEAGGILPRGFNWYVAGNLYHEDGWRQHSSSDVRQAFAKLGWANAKTTVFLSGSYANNQLAGNGTADFRFLKNDWTSVNTIPDINWDRSPALTLNVNRQIDNSFSVSANAYYRHVRTDTTSGDLNNDSFDQNLYTLSKSDIAALTAAGYTGFPLTGSATTQPWPYWRCIAQSLQSQTGGEPSEKCNGVVTKGSDKQNSYGLSGLLTWRTSHNRLAIGASWDRGTSTYNQLTQLGYLNPDNISFTLIPYYLDGNVYSNGDPVDTRVHLHGTSNTGSIYATDTWTHGPLTLTLSGRYNHSSLDNVDYLPPSSARGNLTSNNLFQRFNPAVGFTYKLRPSFVTYFNYSEASRSPTSVELGCSDPTLPCNLPNAILSDPPLEQVLTRNFEVGVRSSEEHVGIHWSANYFFGQNYNDLLFVASEQTGFGYFLNFGKTRRDGVELELGKDWRSWGAGANYTFLNATYQTAQTINGGSNNTNDSAQGGQPGLDGNINIVPGNFIPQVPRNMLKIFGQYRPTKKLTAELDIRAVGSSFARGNENNLYKPDGMFYNGSGKSAGYTVADLGLRYQIHTRIQIFAQMNNLLDTHYSTGAMLSTTPFDNTDRFIARPFGTPYGTGDGQIPLRSSTFLAPGAPFDIYGGLRITIVKH
jgi:outer membrane receptor protein involved in Fe transport